MPAKGTSDAAALPAQIRLWMLDHPGQHSTAAVADGLTMPEGITRKQWVMKVGNAMARLARTGKLEREQLEGRRGTGSVTYWLPRQEVHS